jgi:ADP-L-glycero-D-manno-heptose 6-epimerase
MNLFFAGLSKEGATSTEAGKPASPTYKGIVNAGTGRASTFKSVAEALIEVHKIPGRIDYIPFPADLAGRYQHYTQADIASLRALGYTAPFTDLLPAIRETFAQEN